MKIESGAYYRCKDGNVLRTGPFWKGQYRCQIYGPDGRGITALVLTLTEIQENAVERVKPSMKLIKRWGFNT
jgi:hypothetical protein